MNGTLSYYASHPNSKRYAQRLGIRLAAVVVDWITHCTKRRIFTYINSRANAERMECSAHIHFCNTAKFSPDRPSGDRTLGLGMGGFSAAKSRNTLCCW